MSTTRLFDQDAYLGEFEATVERSVCEGGMYRVLLDQTAFFPEGGGQPADEGTLDGIFVITVLQVQLLLQIRQPEMKLQEKTDTDFLL